MILYKYCGPAGVNIFNSNRIGLTRPRAFNDPFEFSPNVSGIADGMDMVRQTQERTKNFVVLCLAENPDDPLMWGHYAAGLNGIVIGFDTDKGILAEPSAHRRLGKVVYVKNRPTKPAVSDFTDEEMFFSKSEVWAYEREWRILDFMSSASHRPWKKSYDTWWFRLNPESVVEVICGWKAVRVRERFEKILRREQYEHVILRVARLDQRIYRIICDEHPRAKWEPLPALRKRRFSPS
jgi:hypothetical protein